MNPGSKRHSAFNGIMEKTIEDEAVQVPPEHQAKRQLRTSDGRTRVRQQMLQ